MPRESSQKIAFFYIDRFGPLAGEQVNLDSAIHCTFKKTDQQWELRVCKGRALPEGFWNVGDGDAGVTDVSLVVGVNGSGKTSIARYLAELSSRPRKLKRYLVVYKAAGSYFYIVKGYKVRVKGNVPVKKIETGPDLDSPDYNLRFLYVTPHYVTHSIYENADNDYAVDLSTRRLLERCQRRDRPSGGKGRKKTPLPLSRFEREEQRRMFRFLSAVYEECDLCEAEQAGVPSLNGLKVSISSIRVREAVNYILQRQLGRAKVKELRNYRENQMLVAKCVGNVGDWFTRAFFSYALCYWYEHDICGDCEINGRTYGGDLAEFCAELIDEYGIDKDFASSVVYRSEIICRITGFLQDQGPRYDEFDERADPATVKGNSPDYEVFRALRDLAPDPFLKKNSADFRIKINDAETRRNVRALLSTYRMAAGLCDFLDFGFHPILAAGQEALFTMWARIYDWFVNPRRLQTPKEFQRNDPYAHDPEEMSEAEFMVSQEPFDDLENVIVFFDEAETSLHPEWQRRLVDSMLWFFRRFNMGYNIQVIFASHSPILLTDVPKENVHFLFAKGRKVQQSAAVKRLGNTFAANLYDLYQMSYFLENGPIGEFAKRKIEALVRQPDDRVRELVGDELLKRMLPQEGK